MASQAILVVRSGISNERDMRVMTGHACNSCISCAETFAGFQTIALEAHILRAFCMAQLHIPPRAMAGAAEIVQAGGVELPANSHLLLLWGAANRDPAHFEIPGEFRLDRAEVEASWREMAS